MHKSEVKVCAKKWQNENADKIEIVDFTISDVGNMNQFFYQITRKASEIINSDNYRERNITKQETTCYDH